MLNEFRGSLNKRKDPRTNDSLQMGAILGQQKRNDSETTEETLKERREDVEEDPPRQVRRAPLLPLARKPMSGSYAYDERELAKEGSSLNSEMASLKQIVLNEVRRNKVIAEVTHQAQNKLDLTLKYFEDQYALLQNKFTSRLQDINAQLFKEKQLKNELADKIVASEQNQREILVFMRRVQEQGILDLGQIKQTLSLRSSQDNIELSRQKEKTKALFLEVVRLGEMVERGEQRLAELSASYENRLLTVQTKHANSEKNIMTLAQRDSSGSNFINELTAKLQRKIQSLQNNLILLGKEHLRSTEGLANVTSTCTRLSEDVSSVIGSMTVSLQQKIQHQTTELVERLIAEHEERLRGQDEIKNNLDLKERLQREREAHGREEMLERYNSMDSLVRAEFMRKDEALRGLQKIIEDQARSTRQQLLEAEDARGQLEGTIAKELQRVQEGYRKEMDAFRSQQFNIAEKVNEIIRREIQTRLATDMDLKNLTRAVAGEIVESLNQLKESFELFQRETKEDVARVNQEAAGRASKLSHYIDAEVEKVKDTVGGKYQKLKVVFTKITEQFKTHLITSENNRKDMDRRMTLAQRNLSNLRGDTDQVVDQIYEDLQNRVKEEKEALEALFLKKTAELALKVNRIEQNFGQNISYFKDAIDQNRAEVGSKLKTISEGSVASTKEDKLEKIAEQAELLRNETAKLNQDMAKRLVIIEKELQAKNKAQPNVGASDFNLMKNELKELWTKTEGQLQTVRGSIGKLKSEQEELEGHVEGNTKSMNKNMENLDGRLRGQGEQMEEIMNILKEILSETENSINHVKSEQMIAGVMVKTELDNIEETLKRVSEVIDETHSSAGRDRIQDGTFLTRDGGAEDRTAARGQAGV